MNTTPQDPNEQASALAAFDDAYRAFLAAFAQAPDAALSYVPPGDEYALGALPPHLIDPIGRYLAVLDVMLATGFAPIDRSAGPEGAERAADEARHHALLVSLRPTGAERQRLLVDLEAARRSVLARIQKLDEATFTRQAPVIYAAGSDPYPTSARDILGWLADHYREHEEQVGAILAQWHAEHGA